ncbi:alanine--glyoxylate aminotransferase family protein [candidate division KSB1 bacterium]|nr:alanine--glyoxylate aminotransferase family protein [candidate division KSB1 bacterium]
MHTKLFIPGPINISDRVREIRANHFPYGHRTPEISKRLKPVFENLKKLLYIDSDDYISIVSTSSGTGLMEGAVRNCVKDDEKVLMVSIGAFGDLWYNVAKKNGKQTEYLKFNPGEPADVNVIEDKLKTGEFVAICITHNETSTGVINKLEDVSVVTKKYNVLLLVDAVSSIAGMPIKVQENAVDVVLTSGQKSLGIDAGFAVGAVSQKALEKAAQVPNRGYYFDFVEFQKYREKGQTATTPNEVTIDELQGQLEYILNVEGLENRFARIKQLADYTRSWATSNGLTLFPKSNPSDTVVCIENTKGFDLGAVKTAMLEKGFAFDAGYRKLNDALKAEGKHTTFRIPIMGDITKAELDEYLGALEGSLT